MPEPPAVSAAIRRELQLQALAESHDWVVTTEQLHALGFSDAAISRRVRQGRLYRVFRGVYAVGRRDLTQRGRFRAAALAIGDDAAVGYFAAAALMQFWRGRTDPIDVVVPRQIRSRKGICVHTAALPPSAITVVNGIRVTTAEQAILDLATVIHYEHVFQRIVHEAQVQEKTTVDKLKTAIDRAPGHPGAERLGTEIAYGPTPTRSGDEDEVANVLRANHFPPFETNAYPDDAPA